MMHEVLWILVQICTEPKEIVDKIFFEGNSIHDRPSLISLLVEQALSSHVEATYELAL